MHYLYALLVLSVVNRSAKGKLVARQWAQMPFCGQECVHAAPLGTCSDMEWNCLCRTDAFMLSCVACISGHCDRTGFVDPSLRALEGQCKSNGVNVALSRLPPAPPRSTQSGTLTFAPPQNTPTSNIPSATSSPIANPPAASQASSTDPTTHTTPTSHSTTRPGTSTTLTSTGSSTPTTTASTTTSTSATPDSNVIGPDLNAGSTGLETKKISLVPIIAGVVSGAVVLIIFVVAFFLVYMRRLKRRRDESHQTNYPETQQLTDGNSNTPPTTQWGQSGQSTLSPSRRLSTGSSHSATSPGIGQTSFVPPSSSKGWSNHSSAPMAPRVDSSSSSDIYVRHEDSGVVITPSSYGVVELPPEYRKLRHPTS